MSWVVQVRFGTCRLETENRQFFRGEREVHLSPKAFELLKLLVENRPRALAKAELLERVWPSTFVSEGSLARAITEIRNAIGDEARKSRFVRTVHGFGYAFAGKVTEVRGPAEAALASGTRYWVIWGSREVRLDTGENDVGRDPQARVQLDSPKVSRHHARILLSGSDAVLEDLGSKNGTFLCGEKVTAPVPLQHGDEIAIGPFRLTFRVTGGSGATETEMA
jgi:DNA-binding winged helix-turn-helix (wHTH) protein